MREVPELEHITLEETWAVNFVVSEVDMDTNWVQIYFGLFSYKIVLISDKMHLVTPLDQRISNMRHWNHVADLADGNASHLEFWNLTVFGQAGFGRAVLWARTKTIN